MALLGKVFVGGKVQPSEGSIDPSQLCLATAAQASPLLVNNNPSRDEKYSSHRRSRPSSSSISSAFQHVRPAPRVLVFVVSLACMLWTLMVMQLTIAPNYTVNWVMKTQSFDGGSFWLLVDPSPTVLALGILGLWTVGIGYLSLLMRIVKLGKPIQAKESEEDNLLQPKLMIFRRSLAHDESIWHQRAASTIQLVKEIADGGSPLGYAAKVAIKFGDFLTDFVLLYLNLEAGSPLPLTIVFTTITVSSVLSSAVLVSLPSARTSLLLETLLDTLFDFLVAIAYPCLALIYCFSTFSFDYKVLDINLDIYPSGWFETFAGVIADPVQTAIIHRILKSLRIVSVLDFFVRVGVNLFLCVRLHYIVGLFHYPAWRKRHTFSVVAVHRYFAGALFLCLAVIVVVFVEESIRTSTLACKPHEECRVNAWRWTYPQSNSLAHCPCLTLIDGDQAPKSYTEWMHPKNLTDKVAQLATTRDLQTIQLTNRFLPVLPLELRRCTQLKHVSLIYTHMMELPDWFKDFTNLEYMHIEGIPVPDSSLVSLPHDLFEKMSSLTFIHLAGHPILPVLPLFDGLTGLKSLSLAVLISVAELPSFDHLENLERLQLSSMTGLLRLPDLTPVSSTLKSFVVSNRGTWCCNGFLGTCNLQNPLCGVYSMMGTPAASCLTGDIATAGTKAVVNKFSDDVCGAVLQPGTLEMAPTQAGMAQCNGTLYRECHEPGYSEAMCYSARFMGITCTSNPYPIAMRRRQIKEGVGPSCDPTFEAWLGCT